MVSPRGSPASAQGSRHDSVVFSPDGMNLVTASFDKTARLWQLPPRCQSLIDAARTRLPRQLGDGGGQLPEQFSPGLIARMLHPLRALIV
jgi:WD40 repeat protein